MKYVTKRSIQLLAAVVLLGITHAAAAQAPDTLWTKTFGGPLSDVAKSIAASGDGGHVVAGQTFSSGAGWSDMWLLRVGPTGDTLWTRTFGTVGGYESANSVIRTSDGGYMLVGSEFTTTSNALLIRTDGEGNEVWAKTYGFFDTDVARDVVQTGDGGFVFSGTTRSYHPGFGSSVWLFRTDADGDSLWSRTFGGDSYQDGNAIALASDDGFVITGSYNNGGPQSTDVWLLRTDANGDTLWTSTFGGVGSQEGKAVVSTSDGGFVVAATSFDGGSVVTLIKTDANGDSLWARAVAGTVDGPGSMVEASDGGFVLTAASDDGDVVVVRTDAMGQTLWTATYGGSDSDLGSAVLQTSDGGYVVAGVTDSFGAGQSDIWLIRLVGETSTGSESASALPQGFRLDQNYPNPFRHATTISFEMQAPGNARLTVLNALGQAVRVLVDEIQSAGEKSITWDGLDGAGHPVASGFYLYSLNVGGVSQARSMLVVR